jgi:RNA polymerase sigma-70 factor (ECF subfamily)
MMACRWSGTRLRTDLRNGRTEADARDLRAQVPNTANTPIELLADQAPALNCTPAQDRAEEQGNMLVESRTMAQDGLETDAGAQRSEDASAIARVRAQIVGDLYKSSYHRVFAFARRFVAEDDAEEVAHESFVRLLRVRNLERMQISVAYLLRIAENLIRRRHGQAQRFREVLEQSGRMVPEGEEHLGWGHGGRAPSARSASARTESARPEAERLEELLSLLTPAEHSAVRLIVCEGLDYQAAARSLGVPVSTINNWKHRALAKLKDFIGGDHIGRDLSGRAASLRGRPPVCRAC